MHPDDRIRYAQHLSDLMAAPDGTVLTFQYRQSVPGPASHDSLGNSGAGGRQWCWYERQERVYDRLEGGAVQHVLGVVQDVDARKRAEDRVRYQAQLLDSVDQAIIAVDLDRRIIFWNRFAENLYGWTAEEATGQIISDLDNGAGHALALRGDRGGPAHRPQLVGGISRPAQGWHHLLR